MPEPAPPVPAAPSPLTPTAPVRLAELTTLRLGGPAPALYRATTPGQVAELVGRFDAAGGVLVLGGGSNLVVGDAGIDVPVVQVAVPGIEFAERGPDEVIVTVGAGERWDDVVAAGVGHGLSGVAAMSGIPGSAGATPIQNVSAYGAEIADVLVDVTLYDRHTGELVTRPAAGLELAYRHSNLRGTDRAVITELRLRLSRAQSPVRYAELARVLGVGPGQPAPPDEVRDAVLAIRRGKGMVLDPADPDSISAGSFFTNPLLTAAELAGTEAAIRAALGPEVAPPCWPGGTVAGRGQLTKLPAAWLIERAGFARGDRPTGGRVAISGKHTLALVNTGGATTDELLELARLIRDRVRDRFAVTLRPEPVLVGCRLD